MEFPGAATPEFCDEIIEKYEEDMRKQQALIGPDAELVTDIRNSLNLDIHNYPDWKPYVDEIRKMIFSRVTEFIDKVHVEGTHSLWMNGTDADYIVMRYDPGGQYTWHNDFMFSQEGNGVRTVTWLFYLNDCEEGETEFSWGRKISCEQGKLVLFPSSWTMVHRGLPPVNGSKYLAVGWLFTTWNQGIGK